MKIRLKSTKYQMWYTHELWMHGNEQSTENIQTEFTTASVLTKLRFDLDAIIIDQKSMVFGFK